MARARTAAAAVAAVAFLAAPARALDMGAAAFLDLAAARAVLLVDVRPEGERPALPAVPRARTVRIVWPGAAPSPAANDAEAAFFRALRAVRARHPGLPVVLVCGIGQRSGEAVARGAGYGLRDLAHVAGGLYGSGSDPGLLVEVRMR